MTLFEALPDDITEALFSYCKDDECLNDATLRALRTELKLDKAEHNKYSHDCLRCDKFKELKKENAELEAQVEKMSELINRYYMVCTEIPKELRTMTFDSCLEDTVKMVQDREVKE